MASDRLEELLRQLETDSPLYAERTGQLSDLIAVVDSRLRSMDGKVATSVKNPQDGSLQLGFSRMSGEWRLWINEFPSDRSLRVALRGASVDLKIRALPLIDPLLEKMLRVQRERLSKLEDGGNVGQLLESLNGHGKEGA